MSFLDPNDVAQFNYYYAYNQAGRVTSNAFQVTDTHSNQLVGLTANYAWDTMGRMTNLTYPSSPALAYQYDSMSRLSGMTSTNYPSSNTNYTLATTATYNAANQISQLTYGTWEQPYTETRTYNSLMQLNTRVVNGPSSAMVNMTYNYTAGQNNGRVSSTYDGVRSETISYGYDMWNRLTTATATATSGNWGESYTFDGFGNLTGKTPTAGSAPAMSLSVSTATNQSSASDANGNPLGPGGVYSQYTWDVENRLISELNAPITPQDQNFAYDPWGRRVWKCTQGRTVNGNYIPGTGEIYFYGATGQRLETYSYTYDGADADTDTFNPTLEGINVYFGKKLLQSKGVWVATDRLGSVRANSNGEAMSYFPYGEEHTSTADNREKFGTYYRDGIGQDYAEQRYYSASTAAFWTPDPGGMTTANPKDPSTWNRYPYAGGDPANHSDPGGMEVDSQCGPGWETDPSLEGPCCQPGNQFLGAPLDPACYAPGGDAPLPPPQPIECEANLFTRPINYFPAGQLGYTHTYWQVQEYDPNTGNIVVNEVIGGGPLTVGGVKYLDAEQHDPLDSASYSGPDTISNGTLAWSSGFSADDCAGVNAMIAAATAWPQNTFRYTNYANGYVLNSNFLAWYIGVANGGFNPPSPIGAWGWPGVTLGPPAIPPPFSSPPIIY